MIDGAEWCLGSLNGTCDILPLRWAAPEACQATGRNGNDSELLPSTTTALSCAQLNPSAAHTAAWRRTYFDWGRTCFVLRAACDATKTMIISAS